MGNRVLRPDMSSMKVSVNPLTVGDFKVIVRKKLELRYNNKGEKKDIEHDLEYERYVKVFVDADSRKIMAELSGSAKSLLVWIMYELKSGEDYIWISVERYLKENEIHSVNTYKVALRELVGTGLLAASLIRGVYWINPKFFFMGSRINKYRDKIEVYSSKKEIEEESKKSDNGN